MIKSKLGKFLAISSLLALSSCANYNASTLSSLAPTMVISPAQDNSQQEVLATAKVFNKADCKTYLDRDVVAKGYQPIQLFIQNNSDNNYLFSLNRVSLPTARPEAVADKVHTNTVGRAVGYGVGSLILWPLIIPAVVDGIKSSQANQSLDMDYTAKAANDQIIYSHSHYNKILFVPAADFSSSFSVTLQDVSTGELKTIQLQAH